jgi:transposase
MGNHFWLTEEQMACLQPFFPKRNGKPRADERRVLGGVIFTNRNGLRWRDEPNEYGPPKTLYNRWKRWSDKGIFPRMMVGLAAEAVPHDVFLPRCRSVTTGLCLSWLRDPTILPASEVILGLIKKVFAESGPWSSSWL